MALILVLSVTTFSLCTLFLQPKPAQAVSTIPQKINFQGRLTDASGNILPDGTYNIKFKIYDAASGGTLKWSEDWVGGNRIQVTNGLFTVQLGSITSMSSIQFSTFTPYLEIELPTPATATSASPVWTEGPMTPRQPFGSAAYAFNAEQLDGLDSSQFARTDANNTLTGTNAINNTSTTAFQIQNASAAGNLFIADTTNTRVGIGTAPTLTTDILQVAGSIYTNTSLKVGANTSLSTTSLVIGGTTVCNSTGCTASASSGSYIQNTTTLQTGGANFAISNAGATTAITALIKQSASQTGDLIQLQDSSANPIASFSPSGQLKVGGATAYTSVLNVGTNTTTAAGGISFGTDTSLYRSAAGSLTTGGKLGVGLVPSYSLQVGATNAYGFSVDTSTATPNVAIGTTPNAAYLLNIGGTGLPTSFASASTVTGIGVVPVNTSTGDIYGIQAGTVSTAAGTVATQVGVYSYNRVANAGLTLQNAFNFYAQSPIVSSGAITTSYGLYVNTQKIAGVTTGYGIYQGGSADINYFAGKVGINGAPANGNLTIGTNTTTAAGGLYFGTDTNLYRSAANTLATDDTFVINAPISAGDYTPSLVIGQRQLTVSSSGSQGDGYYATWNTTTDRWEATTTSAIVAPTLIQYNYGGTYKIQSAGLANRTAGDALTFVDSFTVQPTGEINLGAAQGKTTLQLTSTAANTGITIGGDTNLYRSGANTLATDDSLTVAGNLTVSGTATTGDLTSGNERIISLTRTVPIVVNDEVDLGTFTISAGAGSLLVNVAVSSGGFSVAKSYTIPIAYNGTAGAWTVALPSNDTGAYGGNNFAIDVLSSTGTVSLRLRRTSGATAGTANISINATTLPSATFSASTATSSVTAPTASYSATNLTQTLSQTIFQGTSTTAFQIQNASAAGNLFVADTTNTRVGVGTTPTLTTDILQVNGSIYTNTSLKVGANTSLSTTALVIGGTTVCNSSGCTAAASSGSYIQNGVALQAGGANFAISNAGATTAITALIKQSASQTGDLIQLQDSSANPIASFSPSGQLKVGGATAYTSVLNVGTNTTTAAGGIAFGTDVNLYRSAANTLAADDSLQLIGTGSNLTVQGTGNSSIAGNLAVSNGLAVSRSATSTDQDRVLSVSGTHSTTGAFNGAYGMLVGTTIAPAGGTVNYYYGQFLQAYASPSASATISLLNASNARNALSGVSPTGTITNSYQLQADVFANQATGTPSVTVANQVGLKVNNQGSGSGTNGLTIQNAIGIDIAAQNTASTSNIGLRVGLASTYSIQLSDTGGTAAGGITFGTDTSLYRSGSTALTSNSSLALGGNLYLPQSIGTGIGFWNGAPTGSGYGIYMSNAAGGLYGDVTDYYLANNFSGGAGRGFIWAYGGTPSAALNASTGNYTIKGTLTANGAGVSALTGGLSVGGTSTLTGAVTGASTITGTTLNGTTGINTGAGAGTQRLTAAGALTNITSYTQTSGSATFNQNAADQFKVLALQAPTTDMVNISNAGQPITTDGINGEQIDYYANLSNAAYQASGLRVNATNTSAVAGATTNGLRVVVTSNVASNANGIKVDNITSGAGTDTALQLGTGWDSLLSYNNTSIIGGTGLLQSVALSGTYTNALTFNNASNSFTGVGTGLTALDATNLTSGTVASARVSGSYTGITGTGILAAGSIASGFGTIATANTITGTTLNGTTGINTGASAGTQRIDSSGNLTNIGTISSSGDIGSTGLSGLQSQANNLNVAQNSSFEVKTDPATQANGWAVVASAGDGTATVARASDQQADGTYSMKLAITGTTSYATVTGATFIPVKPSTSYTHSIDAKNDVTANSCGGGMYIRILWYNTARTFISLSDTYGNAATTTTWTTYTNTITSPANAAFGIPQYYNFQVGGATGCTRWYDNVVLRQTAFSGGVSFATLTGATSTNTPLLQNTGNLTLAATGASSLLFQTNGVTRLTVDSAGAATFSNSVSVTNNLTVGGTSLLTGTVTASTIQAPASTALTLTGNAASTWSTSAGQLTVQSGSGTVSLGTSAALTANGALTISSNTTNQITLDSGTSGTVNVGTGLTAKTINMGNLTGTTSVKIDCGTGFCLFGTGATDHPTTIGSITGASPTALRSGTSGVKVIGGAASSTAFDVQNSSSVSLFTVNSSTSTITLGPASATPTLLVLGTKNTAGDPTCTAGAVYYNSSSQQAKVCINSSWAALGANRVTALPGSPADGDEVYYAINSTAGIVWHLRYNSSSTYWEFLGGPPIAFSPPDLQISTSGGYVLSPSSYLGTPLPRIGDYEMTYSGNAYSDNVGGEVAVYAGSTVGPSAPPSFFNMTGSYSRATFTTQIQLSASSPGEAILAWVQTGSAQAFLHLVNQSATLTPIRIK